MFHLILLMLLPPFIQTLLGAAKSQRLHHINILKQNKTKQKHLSAVFASFHIYVYIYINLATHQDIPGGRGTEQALQNS